MLRGDAQPTAQGGVGADRDELRGVPHRTALGDGPTQGAPHAGLAPRRRPAPRPPAPDNTASAGVRVVSAATPGAASSAGTPSSYGTAASS